MAKNAIETLAPQLQRAHNGGAGPPKARWRSVRSGTEWPNRRLAAHNVGAGTEVLMAEADAAPVRLDVEYPEQLSRLHLLLKSFLGWLYVWIPHGIILGILAYLVLALHVIAFIIVLFTGRYPRGIFDIMVGYHRWSLRVDAYTNLMTDRYPPFSFSAGDDAASLEIPYREQVSRGSAALRFFLGWLYVLIPHGIALIVLGIVALVMLVISWFAILFTGRFPRGMFDFIEGTMRWGLRVNAYLFLLNDKYPPFSLKA